jgi:hypothetical protein
MRSAIEIHRSADYGFSGMGADVMPDFFAQARTVVVDGRPTLLPSWTSWAFQWAVHVVYNDCWAGKIRDLWDMALLLAGRGGQVDWAALTDPARTQYLLRPLWMGLRAVRALFGPEPPEPWGRRLRELAGQPFPQRDLPDWIMRKSLLESSLFRALPLSVMSAMNMAAILPCWTPRFAREFGRIFLAPPSPSIEEQYGLEGKRSPRALLVAARSLHVFAIIAGRVAGKLGLR